MRVPSLQDAFTIPYCGNDCLLSASLKLVWANGSFMAFSGASPQDVILNPALDVLRGHPCASHIAHFPVGLCHTCLFSCARDIGNFFIDRTKGHNAVVGYSIPLVTGYYRSRIAFMTTLTSCRSSGTALRRCNLRVVSLCLYQQV